MPYSHIVQWTETIASMLVSIGAEFKIDSLENLGHPSMYVEGNEIKDEYRGDIRATFYGSKYRGSAVTWKAVTLKAIIDPSDSSRFIDQMTGKSEPRSIRGEPNDNVTIDHMTHVVDHWNSTGNNTRQTARLDFYSNTGGLRLVSWSNNSTDGALAGAAGDRYQPQVGPDFRGPGDKDQDPGMPTIFNLWSFYEEASDVHEMDVTMAEAFYLHDGSEALVRQALRQFDVEVAQLCLYDHASAVLLLYELRVEG